MKFSAISLLALPALFLPALAAPASAAVDTAVVERRQVASAYTIVSDLYTQIQQYTGNINATADALGANATPHEKTAAAKTFRQNVRSITAAVKAATKQVDGLTSSSSAVKRQTDETLASEIVDNLLLEISGTLNNVDASLGLGSLGAALDPLVSSLSALLLALEAVVDNLLALVETLVNDLLTGLSIGLAGLGGI